LLEKKKLRQKQQWRENLIKKNEEMNYARNMFGVNNISGKPSLTKMNSAELGGLTPGMKQASISSPSSVHLGRDSEYSDILKLSASGKRPNEL